MQKCSYPVVTDDYAINALGADEVITSDELFYTALVSFGSFGVIHGYLIETEKQFQLKVEVLMRSKGQSGDKRELRKLMRIIY